MPEIVTLRSDREVVELSIPPPDASSRTYSVKLLLPHRKSVWTPALTRWLPVGSE